MSGILKGIRTQCIQPCEIIVVIDGSTDNTLEVLSKFSALLPNLRIIEQENSGRASVRNRGAREATGDLLLFFDDDMRPNSDCLSFHVAHHEAYPESISTGAQIDNCNKTDIQRFKSILTWRWTSQLLKMQGRPLMKESIFLTAANFSIPRSLFWKLGGFDERLTDAEDFDLAVRASDAGISLYYNHDAFAYHEDKVTGASYIKRLRQYRLAHEQLRQLEPQRYSSIPLNRPKMPTGVKFLFFRFFARTCWVKWLDLDTLKKLIPRWIRYRLYDYIITANGVYFPAVVPLP